MISHPLNVNITASSLENIFFLSPLFNFSFISLFYWHDNIPDAELNPAVLCLGPFHIISAFPIICISHLVMTCHRMGKLSGCPYFPWKLWENFPFHLKYSLLHFQIVWYLLSFFFIFHTEAFLPSLQSLWLPTLNCISFELSLTVRILLFFVCCFIFSIFVLGLRNLKPAEGLEHAFVL